MSSLKTRPSDASPAKFIQSVEHNQRRVDAETLLTMFTQITGRKPVMWGESIIGFGEYRYTNTRGTYSWLMTGFSPRKSNTTIYVMQGFEKFQKELAALGKVKTAKSCLYITNLEKIDRTALEDLLMKVVSDMEARYDCI